MIISLSNYNQSNKIFTQNPANSQQQQKQVIDAVTLQNALFSEFKEIVQKYLLNASCDFEGNVQLQNIVLITKELQRRISINDCLNKKNNHETLSILELVIEVQEKNQQNKRLEGFEITFQEFLSNEQLQSFLNLQKNESLQQLLVGFNIFFNQFEQNTQHSLKTCFENSDSYNLKQFFKREEKYFFDSFKENLDEFVLQGLVLLLIQFSNQDENRNQNYLEFLEQFQQLENQNSVQTKATVKHFLKFLKNQFSNKEINSELNSVFSNKIDSILENLKLLSTVKEVEEEKKQSEEEVDKKQEGNKDDENKKNNEQNAETQKKEEEKQNQETVKKENQNEIQIQIQAELTIKEIIVPKQLLTENEEEKKNNKEVTTEKEEGKKDNDAKKKTKEDEKIQIVYVEDDEETISQCEKQKQSLENLNLYIIYLNQYINYDKLFILPDKNSDYFGLWDVNGLGYKDKEVSPFNIYIIQKTIIKPDKEEKEVCQLFDKNGQSDITITRVKNDEYTNVLNCKLTNYNGSINNLEFKITQYPRDEPQTMNFDYKENDNNGAEASKQAWLCSTKNVFVDKMNDTGAYRKMHMMTVPDEKTKLFGKSDQYVDGWVRTRGYQQILNIDTEQLKEKYQISFSGQQIDGENTKEISGTISRDKIQFQSFPKVGASADRVFIGKKVTNTIYQGFSEKKNKSQNGFSEVQDKQSFWYKLPNDQNYEMDAAYTKKILSSSLIKTSKKIIVQLKEIIKQEYAWLHNAVITDKKVIAEIAKRSNKKESPYRLTVLIKILDILSQIHLDSFNYKFLNILFNVINFQFEYSKLLPGNENSREFFLNFLTIFLSYLMSQANQSQINKNKIVELTVNFIFKGELFKQVKLQAEKEEYSEQDIFLLKVYQILFNFLDSIDITLSSQNASFLSFDGIQKHFIKFFDKIQKRNEFFFPYNPMRYLYFEKKIEAIVKDIETKKVEAGEDPEKQKKALELQDIEELAQLCLSMRSIKIFGFNPVFQEQQDDSQESVQNSVYKFIKKRLNELMAQDLQNLKSEIINENTIQEQKAIYLQLYDILIKKQVDEIFEFCNNQKDKDLCKQGHTITKKKMIGTDAQYYNCADCNKNMGNQKEAYFCSQCYQYKCKDCYAKIKTKKIPEQFFNGIEENIMVVLPLLISKSSIPTSQTNQSQVLFGKTIENLKFIDGNLEFILKQIKVIKKLENLSDINERIKIFEENKQKLDLNLYEKYFKAINIIAFQSCLFLDKQFKQAEIVQEDMNYFKAMKGLYQKSLETYQKCLNYLCWNKNINDDNNNEKEEESILKKDQLFVNPEMQYIEVRSIELLQWLQILIGRMQEQFVIGYQKYCYVEKKEEEEEKKNDNEEGGDAGEEEKKQNEKKEKEEEKKAKIENWNKINSVYEEVFEIEQQQIGVYFDSFEAILNKNDKSEQSLIQFLMYFNYIFSNIVDNSDQAKEQYQITQNLDKQLRGIYFFGKKNQLVLSKQFNVSLIEKIVNQLENLRVNQAQLTEIVSQNIKIFANLIKLTLKIKQINFEGFELEKYHSILKLREKEDQKERVVSKEEEILIIQEHFQPVLQRLYIELAKIILKYPASLDLLYQSSKELFSIGTGETITSNIDFIFKVSSQIGMKESIKQSLENLIQNCKIQEKKKRKEELQKLTQSQIEEIKSIFGQQAEKNNLIQKQKLEEILKNFGFVAKDEKEVGQILTQFLGEEEGIKEEFSEEQFIKIFQENKKSKKITINFKQQTLLNENNKVQQPNSIQIVKNYLFNLSKYLLKQVFKEEKDIETVMQFFQNFQLEGQYQSDFQIQNSQQLFSFQQILVNLEFLKQFLQEDSEINEKSYDLFVQYQQSLEVFLIIQKLIEMSLELVSKIAQTEDKNQFDIIESGFNMINRLNWNLNIITRKKEIVSTYLSEIFLNYLNFYTGKFTFIEKEKDRSEDREQFLLRSIFSFIKLSVVEKKEKNQEKKQKKIQDFFNLISEKIFFSTSLEVGQALSYLFINLCFENMSEAFLLANFNCHKRYLESSNSSIEKEPSKFDFQFYQNIETQFKDITSLVQKCDENYYEEDKNLVSYLKFLVENFVKKLSFEILNKQKEEKQVLLDSFNICKILASIINVFPKLVPLIFSIEITLGDDTLIKQNVDQNLKKLKFCEYLMRVEIYNFGQLINKILTVIPFRFQLNSSSISSYQSFRSLYQSEAIQNLCKIQLKTDQEVLLLLSYLQNYVENCQAQVPKNDFNGIMSNIKFCEDILSRILINNREKLDFFIPILQISGFFNLFQSSIRQLKRKAYEFDKNNKLYGKRKQYVYFYYNFLFAEMVTLEQSVLTLSEQNENNKKLQNLQKDSQFYLKEMLHNENNNQNQQSQQQQIVQKTENLDLKLLVDNAYNRISELQTINNSDSLIKSYFSSFPSVIDGKILENFEKRVYENYKSLKFNKSMNINSKYLLEILESSEFKPNPKVIKKQIDENEEEKKPEEKNVSPFLVLGGKDLTEAEKQKLQILVMIELKLMKELENISQKQSKQLVGVEWMNSKLNLTKLETNKIRNILVQMPEEERMQLLRRMPIDLVEQFEEDSWTQQMKDFKKKIFGTIDKKVNYLDSQESSQEEEEDEDFENLLQMDSDVEDLQFQKVIQEEIFYQGCRDEKLEKTLLNKNFYLSFPVLSDDCLTCLILILMKQSSRELQQVMQMICANPINCYKVFDAITFILLLEKEDFEALKAKDSKIAQINDDPEKFMANLTSMVSQIFAQDSFLEKIQNKWGYQLMLFGRFNKFQKPYFLNYLFQQEKQQSQNYTRSIEFIEQARKILVEKSEDINKQKLWNDFTFLYLISKLESVTSQELIKKFKKLFTYGKIYIEKPPILQIQEEKKQLKKTIQDHIEEKLHYYSFLFKKPIVDNEQQEQNKEENTGRGRRRRRRPRRTRQQQANENNEQSDKKGQNKLQEKQIIIFDLPKWPFYNYSEMFNNQDLFNNFMYCVLNTKDVYLQKIFKEYICHNPKKLQYCLLPLFEEPSQQINGVLNSIIEKSETFKNEYIEKNKAYDPKKTILEQAADKHKEVAGQYIEKIKEDFQKVKPISVQVWNAAQYLKDILKLIYQRIYKITQSKQDAKKEIFNLKRNFIPVNKEQEAEFEKKLVMIEQKQERKKQQIKRQTTSIVQGIVSSLPQLNHMFRQYVELAHLILKFFGFDEKTAEVFSEIQVAFAQVVSSITVIANEFKGFLQQNEEDDLEDLMEQPKLSRIYTSDKSEILSSQPVLKKIYSSSKDNKQQMDLQEIFDLIFSEAYFFFNNLKCFTDQQVQDIFYLQGLKRAKGNYMPFKEKIKAIKYLAFKRAKKIKPLGENNHDSILIDIDKQAVWNSTIKHMFDKWSPMDIIQKPIQMKLDNYVEAGGLMVEWLSMLTKEVFSPAYGLFMLTSNKRSIQPSPLSYLVPNYLTHFRYLGRLVGKALIGGTDSFEHWNFEVSFAKSFLKHILGKNLYVDDVSDINSETGKSLIFMLQNNIGEEMDLDYQYQINIFDKVIKFELQQNGKELLVTDQNKKDYVKAVAKSQMTDMIEKQTLAFKEGLYDIIPQEALKFVSENELGLHLSGMPTLDVDELEQFCNLSGYTKTDDTIKYFFQVVREMDDTQKANLIFFFSGSFKIPVNGFKDAPLKLQKGGNVDQMPTVYTCFHQVTLPDYKKKAVLKEKLLMAVMEGKEGYIL